MVTPPPHENIAAERPDDVLSLRQTKSMRTASQETTPRAGGPYPVVGAAIGVAEEGLWQ